MNLFAALALVVLVAVATWADVRTRRIPNSWVLLGAAGALVVRALLGGAAFLDGVEGLLLAFVIALPLFALGAFGGGDGKLFMAVGAFLGPRATLIAGACAVVVGALYALYIAVRVRRLGETVARVHMLALGGVTGSLSAARSLPGSGLRVAFAPAIALGTCVALFWPSL